MAVARVNTWKKQAWFKSQIQISCFIIHQVFADNEAAVADCRSGKRNADKAFTEFLMKATKGQANPQVALKLLSQELAKLKED